MSSLQTCNFGSSSETKSMASTNQQVNNHIHDDLAFNILSKFPVKSLKRFRRVHKSWAHLFENPHFMSMYRRNFISKHERDNDDSRVLFKQSMPRTFYEDRLFSLSGERFENMMKLDWPPPFQEDDRNIFIMGSSINGTLCLTSDYAVVLWNPATAEFKVIPNGTSTIEFPLGVEISVSLEGFGYDIVRDDYKLIRCATVIRDRHNEVLANMPEFPEPIWQIYSLSSNCWRKLDVKIPCHNFQVYLNGVCHWWGPVSIGEEVLVSFNLSNEEFLTTPLEHQGCYTFGFRHLTLLNGSIAMITCSFENDQFFHISILGELGVKQSWTKLFTLGPLNGAMYPIGVGKKCDIFFSKDDEEVYQIDSQARKLVRFDISTQAIKEIGLNGKYRTCQIVIYKESFLPIGGIDC